jgi:hypothetical protein
MDTWMEKAVGSLYCTPKCLCIEAGPVRLARHTCQAHTCQLSHAFARCCNTALHTQSRERYSYDTSHRGCKCNHPRTTVHVIPTAHRTNLYMNMCYASRIFTLCSLVFGVWYCIGGCAILNTVLQYIVICMYMLYCTL